MSAGREATDQSEDDDEDDPVALGVFDSPFDPVSDDPLPALDDEPLSDPDEPPSDDDFDDEREPVPLRLSFL